MEIARELSRKHAGVFVLHPAQLGELTALRAGLSRVTGDYIGILDAVMEYDSVAHEMLKPCLEGKADQVSVACRPRSGVWRVLCLWHGWMNRLLVFGSSLFSNMDASHLKTHEAGCMLFSRDVIRQVEQAFEDDRFDGPETTAKAAQSGVMVYERALTQPQCHCNGFGMKNSTGAPRFMRVAPLQMRMLLFLFVLLNLFFFSACISVGAGLSQSLVSAYILGNGVNFGLCAAVFFRRIKGCTTSVELGAYFLVLACLGVLDYLMTSGFMFTGMAPFFAKFLSALLVVAFNLALRWRMEPPENEAR